MDIKLKKYLKIKKRLIWQWEKLNKKTKLMKMKVTKIGNKKTPIIEF